MKYVIGFMFNKTRDKVLLIEKLKPEWQKGKLNGIGGKIEIGESPEEAMRREFEEEAGFYCLRWRRFAVIQGEWGKLYCFYSHLKYQDSVKSMEAEKIVWKAVSTLPKLNCIPNIRWIVPMALNTGYAGESYYKIDEIN